MKFEFATAGRILFGAGTRREVPEAAATMGRRVMVVTGASGERASELVAALPSPAQFRVTGEPSIDTVREAVSTARSEGCEVVISIGGGSTIDAGKAIAALLTNAGDPLDYLEV